MVAPEQANDMYVTEICGLAFSIDQAACAEGDSIERWQRASHQTGFVTTHGEPRMSYLRTIGTSGAPSPEAYESPSATISRSLMTTFCVTVGSTPVPSALVTFRLTGN